MIKEIKYNGFSASPGDHEALEGDLCVAMNLIPEHNTIRPVMPPAKVFELPEDSTIMCVHKVNGGTHYVLYYDDGRLAWKEEGQDAEVMEMEGYDFSGNDVIKVEPIGNTLVILTNDGVHYLLWVPENDSYKYLGQKPPETSITFGLNSRFEAMPGFSSSGTPSEQAHIRSGEILYENFPVPTYDGNGGAVPPQKYTQVDADFDAFDFSMEGMVGNDGTTTVDAEVSRITQHALAVVNKFISTKGSEKGRFIFPFFVRYAYELYDGSLYMHSCPVLMIPNSRGPVFALNPNAYADDEWDHSGLILRKGGSKVKYAFNGRVIGFTSALYYELYGKSLSDWKDIIRSVSIYVSAPIYTYDQAGKVYGWKDLSGEGEWDSYYTLGRIKAEDTNMDSENNSGWLADEFKRWNLKHVCTFDAKKTQSGSTHYLFGGRYTDSPDERHVPECILSIPEHTKENIDRRIAEECNFYKIHEIDIEKLLVDHSSTPLSSEIKIEDGVLESLVSRERMSDDYQTRDLLSADMSSVYNGRINMAGVKRTLHKPTGIQFQWPKCVLSGQNLGANIAVKVKTEGQVSVVTRERTLNAIMASSQTGPLFFFHADINATTAYINWDGETYELPLKKHGTLNGAYWLGNIWGDVESWKDPLVKTIGDVPTERNKIIDTPNKVYTSEVNNPFYFPSTGINTIGTGKIIGICSAVKAMSQGQFGQFPLYAFTDDGVWALQTTSDGGFSAVTPVTRDVCLDADSITQLDDAVLFTTSRGIMLISGSQAQCISETIDDDGQPFSLEHQTVDAMETALGLDVSILPFKDFTKGCRMIYDYPGQRIIVYNPDFSYAYIYSLESKKWGMMQSNIDYSIRSYPAALAVNRDGWLVNCSVGDGSAAVTQMLITRPLSLDQPDVLKTVTTVLQRGLFAKRQGHVRAVLYGSRDLYNWHMVMSSTDENMRGRRGTPYKWFRVALLLRLPAGESVTGCSIQYDTKYTNRLR